MTSIPEEEKQKRHSLINTRLDMLLAVFNKRLKSDALGGIKRVFDKMLEIYPPEIISRAFSKAECEFEKFPTPKRMSELCNELMPPHATRPILVCDLCRPDGWKSVERTDMPPTVYQLIGPGNKLTGETRTVPHKMAVRCDHFGQRTYYDNEEEVFRAEDCPEGREFLATLKRIAEEKTLPSKSIKQMLMIASDPNWQDNWQADDEAYLEQLRVLAAQIAEAKAQGIEIPLSPQEREALWLLKPLAVRKRWARMKARKEFGEL